jgi:hypothetical protein
MRNSLLITMKEFFKPKSLVRSYLATSKVVARFEGRREPIHNPWARRAAQMQGLTTDGSVQELLIAIPRMFFSPYGPSWLTLRRRVGDPEAFDVFPGSLPVTSKEGLFLDQMAGVKLLDPSLEWSVTWFVTCTSQKPLSSFAPGNQYLQQLPNGGPFKFWPRAARQKIRPALACDDNCDGDDDDNDDDGPAQEALALEDAGEPDDPEDVVDDSADHQGENALAEGEDDDEEYFLGPIGGRAPTTALAKATFANGCTISVYRDGRFEAVCRHASHHPIGRCRLTRTRHQSDDASFAAQGRPLGLLAAWCLCQGEFDCKDAHCDPYAVYMQGFETRCNARTSFKLLHGALDLLKYERDQRPGEGEEPIEWA